jgi:transposase
MQGFLPGCAPNRGKNVATLTESRAMSNVIRNVSFSGVRFFTLCARFGTAAVAGDWRSRGICVSTETESGCAAMILCAPPLPF